VALTGQLRDGPVRPVVRGHLTGTAAVAAEIAAARPPIRPSHVTGPDHWALVGGAARELTDELASFLHDVLDPHGTGTAGSQLSRTIRYLGVPSSNLPAST